MSNRPSSDCTVASDEPAGHPPGGPRPGAGVPFYTTEELFSGSPEIRLAHAGAEYRLKITRQGKLILNK